MLDDRKTAILSAVVQEYIATALPGGFDPHRRRARRSGVLGHGAQRDGGARAGGLPRPAPHVGRPHPHRQGLPLLRRPPRHARARSIARRRAGRRVLPLGRTAGWRRCSINVRPAGQADELRRRRRRAAAPRRSRSAAPNSSGCRRRWRPWSWCSATAAWRASTIDADARRHRRPLGRCLGAPHKRTSVGTLARLAAPPMPDRRRRRRPPLRRRARRRAQRSADEHVYVGGTSSMASAFDAVEIVRDVLRTLEQQFVVVSPDRRPRRARPVRGDRRRARRRAARRPARSSSRRSSSTASSAVRSACSGRPA